MLKAILFDLGNTLFDSSSLPLRLVFEEGGRAAYGYLESLAKSLPPFGAYYSMHRRAMQWAFIKSRTTGGEVSCANILRETSRRLKLQLDDAQLAELVWQWYAPIKRHTTVAADVAPTLRKLCQRGLKLVIVSNTFVPATVLDRHLQMENLLEFFEHRVYSCDLGIRKPDPRIFEHALGLVGVKASEAVFVGDNVTNDIRGAQRAGMLAILKQPKSETRTHRIADHLIRNLPELYQILPLLGANPAAAELSSTLAMTPQSP